MPQGNLFCSTFLSRNVVLRSCCAAVALLGMQAQSFAAASHGTGGKAKANVAAGKALPSVQPAGEVRKARQASAPMIARANEDIAVQGTRLANSVLSPSTREHSTVQVFRYGADQLRETGQTNILAAIAQISPAVTSSPFGGIGGNGLNKTMQLRNLGADQTLMLVNGKRRHVDANFNYFQSGPNYGTDPADLSLIPISAIDHVEIITEGATALYGQDAEAGAVNIVLKRDTKGGSINLQNSGYYLGDGQAFDGNANYGLALGHDGGYFRGCLKSLKTA
ncbi:TonB-dependent receptor plug domain-containing protein [Gluconacetobacter aggeris]|uniref:TonB-dependent receptor plug domain-containing protein n=1 Tax=Gluconacetobacter aggeris TaxID=1286186 RepID=UPI0038CF310B